jgi:hypothetical protein
MINNTNLQEVVNMQIEEGLRRSYKITTLEEHLKMGRCKLQWFTFCVLMDFLQIIIYSNAINALQKSLI